jgi:deoxyadenosine/deoxycytidine kinase
MTKRFILVAGNIGSGKTSLTDQLGTRLGYMTAHESVADNPYLADFYDSMAAWAFHLQVFFLGHRAEQHFALALAPESAICDRSLYEDYYIFARALRTLGNLSERDFRSYERLFHLVVRGLPAPDLLLFLKASTPTLLGRIRRRARPIEAGITADYLDLLNRLYAEWLAHFDLCPVLTIPADDLDFVHRPAHFDLVVSKIQAKLAGQEIVVFPTDEMTPA